MARESQHVICRLADEAAAISEPEGALRKLRELRVELDSFERSRVGEALRLGSSFGTVAKALGISRQSAHRRYRHLAPTSVETLPLSSHARRAVHLAHEEAGGSGAHGVTSEHLLLGVLRSGGGVSLALEAAGLTVEATRRSLTAATAVRGSTAALHDAGRAVLAEAAAIASARNARYVEPEHIALAALEGPDGGALRAISSVGVSPASVRERLDS